jgi:uncharacterized protein YqgQ
MKLLEEKALEMMSSEFLLLMSAEILDQEVMAACNGFLEYSRNKQPDDLD